ncbi:MAG: hypothetical protein GXP04_05130 [Alphaproteobacteria bacterium]|nr:hypothetical protein [Alphaproteobacteria bacterium]
MRRYVMLLHLYIAAFVAPVFILVAISGGLYLFGIKGDVTKTPLELPADATLDFSSRNLEDNISALLAAQSVQHRFEYLKMGATSAVTRPTSRISYEFKLEGGKLIANRVKPNLQKTMIELHKGHGPTLFKAYQKLVAISLILVVLSGLWMGLTSRALLKKTAITSGAGLIVFVLLAFLI